MRFSRGSIDTSVFFAAALATALCTVSEARASEWGAVPSPKLQPPQENEVAQDPNEHLQATIDEASHKRFLHGFRLGYLYVNGIDNKLEGDPTQTLRTKYGIRSPHQFLLGYETTWRLVGRDWLNILLVGNVMIAGLEQSKLFPSANGIIGFEIQETFQVGVGVNANPVQDKPAHMLIAAGYTPRIGDLYTPIHAFFIPDVDGQHRMGMTVGVNF